MINDLQQVLRDEGYTIFDTVVFCGNISTENEIEHNLQKLSKALGHSKIALLHYENMSFHQHFDTRFVTLVKQNKDKIKIFVEGKNNKFIFPDTHQHNEYYLELRRGSEPKVLAHTDKTKDFLLLIHRDDKPRIDLVKQMEAKSLLANSLVSANAPQYKVVYELSKDDDWRLTNKQKEDLSWLVYPYPPQYEKTICSIVCESIIDEPSFQLSEKTYKPIMMCHPFVVLGPKGMLSFIRSMGFKTFSPFIDESYDEEINLEKRIQLIVSACEQIFKRDWKKFYEDTLPIRLHNYNLFYKKRPTFLSPIYDDLTGYLDRI
tara:strand:+ start:948 stop:1901 length:954 start_codon:yes stop_codon:yes gene_type:complete